MNEMCVKKGNFDYYIKGYYVDNKIHIEAAINGKMYHFVDRTNEVKILFFVATGQWDEVKAKRLLVTSVDWWFYRSGMYKNI